VASENRISRGIRGRPLSSIGAGQGGEDGAGAIRLPQEGADVSDDGAKLHLSAEVRFRPWMLAYRRGKKVVAPAVTIINIGVESTRHWDSSSGCTATPS
jgi:hypothetical protein